MSTQDQHDATQNDVTQNDSRSVDPAAPYLLYLYVGNGDLPRIDQASVVDLTPKDSSIEAALDAITSAGLTAADLRTRTLYIAGPGPVQASLVVYAALCGFAGRKLDVSDLREVLEAHVLDGHLAQQVLPATPVEFISVGPGAVSDGRDTVDSQATADVHAARRAFFHSGTASAMEALESLIAIIAIRVRKGSDRFPYLVPGDVENFDPASEEATSQCVDLDDLRRRAAQLRRDRRIDDRGSLVPVVELTERQQRLVSASALPLDGVLIRLGAHEDSETGFWRCPRPERHRNGDANPSAKIHQDGFRCFRCDLEQVDALRLTMDTKGLSPDDAANWLLTR